MSYLNRRSPRRTYRPPPKPVVFGIFQLVLLDGTPLRKAAVSACKRARTSFEKAEAELLEYEKADVPAYERWYRGTFGVLLQEKEQMERDVERVRQRLERMMILRMQTGCSGAEALEQVEQEEAPGERGGPDPEAEAEQERLREEKRKMQEEVWKELAVEFEFLLRSNAVYLQRERQRGRSVRQIRETIKKEFAGALQVPEMMAKIFFMREDVEALWNKYRLKLEEDTTVTSIESDESRIKRLMRELAFALHPDQCGVADERRLELWHQVQVAVKAKDLDRLEVLHAHMQLLQGDLGPGLSVGRIQDLTSNYRKSREALRRKIRELRKQVKWGFSKRKPDEKEQMRKVMEQELKWSLSDMRAEKRHLEKELKRMSRLKAEPEEAFLEDLFGFDDFF